MPTHARWRDGPRGPGTRAGHRSLVLNDDAHVSLYRSDDLHQAGLRRYLHSYCRPGVDTLASCVGDMSCPTLYPSRVGPERRGAAGAESDVQRLRVQRNVENLASEPGGYYGAAFAILRELGKTTLAGFRMNDAPYPSEDSPTPAGSGAGTGTWLTQPSG